LIGNVLFGRVFFLISPGFVTKLRLLVLCFPDFTNLTRNFFNSHLFWLNSHPGRACLVLRACRSAAFLHHNTKKGCEFNQKKVWIKKFPLTKVYSNLQEKCWVKTNGSVAWYWCKLHFSFHSFD
jgi:UPF0716 family protein affecting phage T7 exclusion